jgi:hypothetical protein
MARREMCSSIQEASLKPAAFLHPRSPRRTLSTSSSTRGMSASTTLTLYMPLIQTSRTGVAVV